MNTVLSRSVGRAWLLAALLPALSSAVSPTLTYYGGPVVSNIDVVQVNWDALVSANVSVNLPVFYADVVQSHYWTVLSEYGTNVTPVGGGSGTNQQLGLGAFAGGYTLTPSICAGSTTCTVTDTQVQNELIAQVAAGHLPAPTTDAAGNVNTVYMVHFPPNVRISLNGTLSCTSGGFCGAYTSAGITGKHAAVGLLPDQETSGCALGCGGGAATGFGRDTNVTAAILTNIATDPQLPLAATVASPVAWYNASSGNVSDLCDTGASDNVVITVNAHSYNVPKLWSNQQLACISAGSKLIVALSATPHGTVSPPLPQEVSANGTVSYTVTPNAGFTSVVGGTCGGNLSGATYTTNPVAVDCTVTVNFSDTIFASGFE